MNTLAQIQEQQRQLVLRIAAVNQAKARRYIQRIAKQHQWPEQDVETVLQALGIREPD